MNPREQLGEFFQLWEFTQSMTARRKNIPNRPTARDIERLRKLCVTLDDFRRAFGPIRILSGFRSPDLNRAVGGSSTSAHPFGCAADIQPSHWQASLRDMMAWGVQHIETLEIDQIIYEYGGWLHIGIPKPGLEQPRHEDLMCFAPGGEIPWDPSDHRVR